MGVLTKKDIEERRRLVDSYNRVKTKESKKVRYAKLMQFETRMLKENKNG